VFLEAQQPLLVPRFYQLVQLTKAPVVFPNPANLLLLSNTFWTSGRALGSNRPDQIARRVSWTERRSGQVPGRRRTGKNSGWSLNGYGVDGLVHGTVP